jgi:ElaB/YqjD/DUF883 family membrane-anchored ribosome-binding protein
MNETELRRDEEGEPTGAVKQTRDDDAARREGESATDVEQARDEGEAPTDVQQARRDVEHTRAELGDTVEALSQKADLKAQVRQRIEERTAGLRARRAELRQRQEDLKAKVADARGRASEATPEDAKRTASQVAQTAEERPFPAIGVAFGAGLLLGWLIARR